MIAAIRPRSDPSVTGLATLGLVQRGRGRLGLAEKRYRQGGHGDCLRVFEPEFSAVCDTCGATTAWHKANRVAEVDGEPSVLEGYKCAECETFETKVLDTEGGIRTRGNE